MTGDLNSGYLEDFLVVRMGGVPGSVGVTGNSGLAQMFQGVGEGLEEREFLEVGTVRET